MSQASVVLTIDKYRLRDLFLPSLAKDLEAIEHVEKMCSLMIREPGFEYLVRALCALDSKWFGAVEIVRQRGGLLLIGGEF